jgi:hypothetical protein
VMPAHPGLTHRFGRMVGRPAYGVPDRCMGVKTPYCPAAGAGRARRATSGSGGTEQSACVGAFRACEPRGIGAMLRAVQATRAQATRARILTLTSCRRLACIVARRGCCGAAQRSMRPGQRLRRRARVRSLQDSGSGPWRSISEERRSVRSRKGRMATGAEPSSVARTLAWLVCRSIAEERSRVRPDAKQRLQRTDALAYFRGPQRKADLVCALVVGGIHEGLAHERSRGDNVLETVIRKMQGRRRDVPNTMVGPMSGTFCQRAKSLTLPKLS